MNRQGSPLAAAWDLEPGVVFLNHGSFGACPRDVLAVQTELRARLERQPVAFFLREYEDLADEARAAAAEFLGADPDDLAFVPNATTGVATVLHALRFHPGDELLTTDHAYRACRNALDAVAERSGACVTVAQIPFPLTDSQQVVDAVLAALTPRTRLALLDHVTSPTGLVLPIERLVAELQGRGVDVLVDAAHAPGMVEVALDRLGAAYWTGNCHKWLCTPKGSALLHVRRDRQAGLAPLAVSHGRTVSRCDRSRFRLEHDWTGTHDPTPWLCIPAALQWISRQRPGGWTEWRAANRSLTLAARDLLCTALQVPAPAPDDMIGSLAALPLPADLPPAGDGPIDALQDRLWTDHRIEVPVMSWPSPRLRLVRVSAQAYNDLGQYQLLAARLAALRGA